MQKNTARPTSSMQPGAVPTGLGSTSAPSGTSACLALLGAISRLSRAKNSSIRRSEGSCTTSLRPKVCASTSTVRSSRVGPRPPETSTISLRSAARRNASRMSAGSSFTEAWKRVSTSMPSSFSERNDLLESTISPRSSSSPIVSTSALTRTLPLRSARRARWRPSRLRPRRRASRQVPLRSAVRPTAPAPVSRYQTA